MYEPPFRKINFDDEPPMITIARHLRRAWIVVPTEEATYDGVSRFLQTDSWRSEEDRRKVPRNPNKDDVGSKWRKAVCFYWNHIFFDIMNFLPHAQADVGHFHVPDTRTFVIDYPKQNIDPRTYVTRKKWDTNVVITPAFLDDGLSVRFESSPSPDENEPWGLLGVFDARYANEAWYIRRGLEVKIYLEIDQGSAKQGAAAVVVYAPLCTQQHRSVSVDPLNQIEEWREKGRELNLG